MRLTARVKTRLTGQETEKTKVRRRPRGLLEETSAVVWRGLGWAHGPRTGMLFVFVSLRDGVVMVCTQFHCIGGKKTQYLNRLQWSRFSGEFLKMEDAGSPWTRWTCRSR